MGQNIGTLVGLVLAFVMCFLVLMLGVFIPTEVIPTSVVQQFLNQTDLELRLAIVGTVLFPPFLGPEISYGAANTTVLTFVCWGTGGLIAGLLSKGPVQGILAAIFAVILGALLTWLLVFLIVPPGDITQILGTHSMILMQLTLQGAIWPGVAAFVGGLLGGGISRER